MHTMRQALSTLTRQVDPNHTYRVGDRVFDSFLFRYGTVIKTLRDGRLEVKFDYVRSSEARCMMHHTEIQLVRSA